MVTEKENRELVNPYQHPVRRRLLERMGGGGGFRRRFLIFVILLVCAALVGGTIGPSCGRATTAAGFQPGVEVDAEPGTSPG
jgi:hypothetical protein